ncbi:hypothetical protein R83H12_02516 [Fibrobacteria bacterium R8-3-H12]
MKKVLAAALICAVSTFAAWDKFPVIEYGKGEAKVGFTQSRQGDDTSDDAYAYYLQTRYSPVENLELMSSLGYTFGIRYQIISVLSAGVDVGFPIPGTAWSFTPNVQFSTPITEALVLGSNVQMSIYTEDSDSKYTNGIDLSAGVELDLSIGKSTVWVSCDINTGLTDSKMSGNKIKPKDEDRGLEIAPALGYVATVGNLSLGTNVGLEFGKDAGHDKFNTVIGVDFSVKF